MIGAAAMGFGAGRDDDMQVAASSEARAAGQVAPEPSDCRGTGRHSLPHDAEKVSTVGADLDGDGDHDRFSVYAVPVAMDGGDSDGSADRPFEGRMRAELAAGPVLDVRVEGWTENAEVVGPADVDGDGRDEVFVNPRDGATAHRLAVVGLEGCRLGSVQYAAGGGEARFLFTATGNSSAGVTIGVECADPDGDGRLDVVETEDDHSLRRWQWTAWRVDAHGATASGSGTGGTDEERPATLSFSAGLSCLGIRYE